MQTHGSRRTGALTPTDRADAGRRVGRGRRVLLGLPAPGACGFFATVGCGDRMNPPAPTATRRRAWSSTARSIRTTRRRPAAYRLRRRRRRPPPGSTAPIPIGSTSSRSPPARLGQHDLGGQLHQLLEHLHRREAQLSEAWPGPALAWRPDGGAFGDVRTAADDAAREPRRTGACDAPEPRKTFSVYQAQYTPAGDRMWWVSANDPQAQTFTLWLADGNGASPVAVATGPNLGGAFSGDGRRLYIGRTTESRAPRSAGSDVRRRPRSRTAVVETAVTSACCGNNRVLFIDHWNVAGRQRRAGARRHGHRRAPVARARGHRRHGSGGRRRRGRERRLHRSRPRRIVARRACG